MWKILTSEISCQDKFGAFRRAVPVFNYSESFVWPHLCAFRSSSVSNFGRSLDWLEMTATEWSVPRCHGFGRLRCVKIKRNNKLINDWSCFEQQGLFLVITSLVHSTYARRVFVARRSLFARSHLFFFKEQIHRRSCLPFLMNLFPCIVVSFSPLQL